MCSRKENTLMEIFKSMKKFLDVNSSYSENAETIVSFPCDECSETFKGNEIFIVQLKLIAVYFLTSQTLLLTWDHIWTVTVDFSVSNVTSDMTRRKMYWIIKSPFIQNLSVTCRLLLRGLTMFCKPINLTNTLWDNLHALNAISYWMQK